MSAMPQQVVGDLDRIPLTYLEEYVKNRKAQQNAQIKQWRTKA